MVAPQIIYLILGHMTPSRYINVEVTDGQLARGNQQTNMELGTYSILLDLKIVHLTCIGSLSELTLSVLTVTRNSLCPCLTVVREDVSSEGEKQPQRGYLCCVHSTPGVGNIWKRGTGSLQETKVGGQLEESCLVTTEPLHSQSHYWGSLP